MLSLLHDVRLAFRMLTRTPGFTVAAVLTLALGIGANTAMLSLADATLLRPLKVVDPDELAALPWSSSYPDYREYVGMSQVFDGVFATGGAGKVNLNIDGAPELQDVIFVSGNTFSVLGVSTAAGRLILPSDDVPGAETVGVLGNDYWTSRFGSSPDAVGKTIRVNGKPVTIVGVLSQDFRGTNRFSNPELYLPVNSIRQISTGFFSRLDVLGVRGLVWLNVVGRLHEHVTIAQASDAINAMYRQLHPPASGETPERLVLTPLTTRALGGETAGALRRFVFLLLGVVGLTLLIGCANLANLLLARAAGRRREIGVRLALGASRGRVIRQMLVESLVLAAVGGTAGLFVANIAFKLLADYQLPGGIGIANLGLSLDRVALASTATLSLCTGLLFGAAPAWRASRPEPLASLRDQGRSTSRSATRTMLVVAQVALTLLLLAGSGLFLRSLVRALNVPLGFEVDDVATASVNLGLARYSDARAKEFYDRTLDVVRTIPNVTAVAWSDLIPTNGLRVSAADIDGYTPGSQEEIRLYSSHVGSEYFRAVRTRILSGRPFATSDNKSSTPVAIVSEAAAAKYWAGRNAIGGRVRMFRSKDWVTVVGVAENTIVRELGEPLLPFIYFPFDQPGEGVLATLDSAHLFMRTEGDVDQLLPAIRDRLRAIDDQAPIYAIQPFSNAVVELVMPQRMGVTLFGFFSTLALSLAIVGIYGVASYVAASRTREIGIRMALGADAHQVGCLVLVQGSVPIAVGIAVGLALALGSARLASGFMHDVSPWDPLTLVSVSLILASLGLLATYVPARRAARLNPVNALRHE